ncbi:MAG: hypothetical protein ACNA8W_25315, partial [Bradymonadaceae bacterium]
MRRNMNGWVWIVVGALMLTIWGCDRSPAVEEAVEALHHVVRASVTGESAAFGAVGNLLSRSPNPDAAVSAMQ